MAQAIPQRVAPSATFGKNADGDITLDNFQ